MLELAAGGGGAAGAGAGAGTGTATDEVLAKHRPPAIVVPTLIIDAATIPAALSSDPDNANTSHTSGGGSSSSSNHNSNISNSNNNMSNPHEINNDSSQSEGMLEEGRVVTVRDLLKGLYEKACQQKLWGLVRHTAGMLGKRVEDLAKAVTDLLVRQKQVTVGMPPNNEHTITAPLPEGELRQLIHDVSNIYKIIYI